MFMSFSSGVKVDESGNVWRKMVSTNKSQTIWHSSWFPHPVLDSDMLGPNACIIGLVFVFDRDTNFGRLRAFFLRVEQPHLSDFDAMTLKVALQLKIRCIFGQI